VVTADFRACTDEELAAVVARGGAEAACRELFERYRRKVYLWSYNVTHDREEAVDCTQEIFIRVFKGIGGFQGRSSFSTWVYRVARNHCLRELSRRRHQWRKRLQSLDEELHGADETEPFWRQVDTSADLDRLLEQAGEHMKRDELEAFVLHYREGLTVKEITRMLGSENLTGARTLIQNARRKFRRLVADQERREG
jgi:RNA polymerase sigma-70 factor (ECF subfamily)